MMSSSCLTNIFFYLCTLANPSASPEQQLFFGYTLAVAGNIQFACEMSVLCGNPRNVVNSNRNIF